MSLIIPANSAAASGGFNVANSVRMNRGDSPSFTRSVSSNGDFNNSTLSMWVKKCSNGIDTNRLWLEFENGTNYEEVRFKDDDTLRIYSESGNSTYFEIITNRKFRDTSAFYHICVIYDYSQATNTNRIKLFINGVQETSFSTFSVPNQGANSSMNKSGNTVYVGTYPTGSNYFDGYLAEMVWLDGTSASVTDFGEFDEDSGIFKPIDVSGLTAGTNGWYMDYESSGSLGNDVFGSNNFTVNNLTAIDQSTDTCTNNMPTMNPLIKVTTDTIDFIDGNLSKNNATADNWRGIISTFAMTSGKWYWEQKVTGTKGSNPRNIAFGVVDISQFSQTTNQEFYATSRAYGYNGNVGQKINNASGSSYGASFTTDDIIGVALDLDNNKIYFSKNGTFQNSGDPTSGSTGTGAAFSITDGYDYTPAFSSYHSEDKYSVNFGSPPFAISSGNTDGNGYGNFEYAVPSGYFAINTKNLAEYG